MKFCKVLENQSKDMPGLNDMFLRYKQLKKKIKAIPARGDSSAGAGSTTSAFSPDEGGSDSDPLSPEEQEFINALNEDLERFNLFFIDKEEDAVIKLQDMTDQLQAELTHQELGQIKQQLVDFHGDLVMTLHWSLINYSAVVKILKKHDKRSGLLLRAPYLANVLQQPFSSTSMMSSLVKSVEELVEKAVQLAGTRIVAVAPQAQTYPALSAAVVATHPPLHIHSSDEDECSVLTVAEATAAAMAELQQLHNEDQQHLHGQPMAAMARQAEKALEMWKALAKTASTPSTIISSQTADGIFAAASEQLCSSHGGSAVSAKRKAETREQPEGPLEKKIDDRFS